MNSIKRILEQNQQKQPIENPLISLPQSKPTYLPPLFSKCAKLIIKPQASKTFFVVLIASIPQCLYTLTNSAIYSFPVFYSDYYNVTIPQIQLVQHAEISIIASIGLFSNKLHQLFTIPNVFLIFSGFIALFNTIIYFNKTYIYLIIMRVLAAIGFSIIYTSTAPLMNQFVYPGHLEAAMTINDLMMPFGELIGIIINLFAMDFDPQLLFLISGIIGIFHFTYCCFFLPRQNFNFKIKFNAILIVLAILGMLSLVISLALLAINIAPLYVFFILFIAGISILGVFFTLNAKFDVKTLPSEIFNKNSIVFILMNFFSAFSYQVVNWFSPLIWRISFGFSTLKSGLFQGFNHVIACLFVFLIIYFQKKITYRSLLVWSNFVQFVLFVCLIIVLQVAKNEYLLDFIFILMEVNFTMSLASIQVFNIYASPRRFAFISGSLVAIGAKIGWSFGTALFTAISRDFDSYFDSAAISSGISVVLLLINSVLGLQLGVFKWERSKLGFSEKLYSRSVAFAEQRFDDDTEVEGWSEIQSALETTTTSKRNQKVIF